MAGGPTPNWFSATRVTRYSVSGLSIVTTSAYTVSVTDEPGWTRISLTGVDDEDEDEDGDDGTRSAAAAAAGDTVSRKPIRGAPMKNGDFHLRWSDVVDGFDSTISGGC